MKYFSGEAAETITNNTICVKEGNRIRKLRDFVNNFVPHGEYVVYDIKPYNPVRYAILNVSFR